MGNIYVELECEKALSKKCIDIIAFIIANSLIGEEITFKIKYDMAVPEGYKLHDVILTDVIINGITDDNQVIVYSPKYEDTFKVPIEDIIEHTDIEDVIQCLPQ